MGEQQESPIPQPNKPREFAFTRLSNGQIIGIFELMERNRKEGAVEINTSLLQEGDTVAFSYPKEDGTNGFFALKITDGEWQGLGLNNGYGPSRNLAGQIQGDDLPSDINGKTVYFTGSGFGGGIRQPGLLATKRNPYFFLPGRGEFKAPSVSNFQIFRRDEGGDLQSLSHKQLEEKTRKNIERHNERLGKVAQLVQHFGFTDYDFRDGNRSSSIYGVTGEEFREHLNRLKYEDKKYIVEYDASMALGNALTIFNKETHGWWKFKYYNYQKEDVLQISFSDLHGRDLNKSFIGGIEDGIKDESAIHRSNASIVTFTTSSNNGIEVTTYKPTEEESKDNLKIPSTRWREILQPTIQLWPAGEIKVDKWGAGILFIDTFDKDPELSQRIASTVKFGTSKDGAKIIDLNGKSIQLKNPDTEIELIRRYLARKGRIKTVLNHLLGKKGSSQNN